MTAAAEKGKERTQELLDILQAGVEKLATSDDWQAMLRFHSKFHRYSWRNTMLIHIQHPGATRVMAYGAKDGSTGWLSVGRQVQKGEKAIRILAPIIVKKEKDGETYTACVGFRGVNVFDVSQTEGDPIPTVNQVEELYGDDVPAGLFLGLADQVLAAGYTIEDATVETFGDSRKGDTNFLAKKVRLLDTLSPVMRAKTLAHELAHVLMHDPAQQKENALDRRDIEVEAESAAYIVLAAAGLDTAEYAFGYVAGWSGGDMKLVAATAARAGQAAKKMLDALEAAPADAVVETAAA